MSRQKGNTKIPSRGNKIPTNFGFGFSSLIVHTIQEEQKSRTIDEEKRTGQGYEGLLIEYFQIVFETPGVSELGTHPTFHQLLPTTYKNQ
jgi:hypothetical protein